MLNLKEARLNSEKVRVQLSKRNSSDKVFDDFIAIDKKWLAQSQLVEKLRFEQKQLTPKQKPTDKQLKELGVIAQKLKKEQENLIALQDVQRKAALLIPNLPSVDTPEGKSESDNKVIKIVGEPRKFDFEPKSHEELAVLNNMIDFNAASKITGSRFAVYRGEGARIERKLINFMLDVHVENHNYEEIMPPAIVNSASLQGTGQLPKFADDSFKLQDTDYWLSPTAEVQLTNLYRDSILKNEDLPIKLAAYTPCFRKEAGSYGKDIKGIIRQHQFNKVELVQIVEPLESEKALQQLLGHAEVILQQLELPYRVVQLCSGDLGFSAAKTYDIEVWFPSQSCYREISSCSNFLDFQARRSMIRFKKNNLKEMHYVHTINGSGLAIGRTFAAILENYQNENGKIMLPSAIS